MNVYSESDIDACIRIIESNESVIVCLYLRVMCLFFFYNDHQNLVWTDEKLDVGSTKDGDDGVAMWSLD